MQTSDEAPLARVHGIAPGFVAHTYRFEAMLPYSRTQVWTWLNTPETFTKGQPWPYRVEFTSGDPVIPADFSEGVMNVHHGPFLNFAGVLTEIRPPEYRDLHYYYGSFAITQRWIRPNRLQFWVEEIQPNQTRIIGQVDSYVKPWISGIWTRAQGLFWGQFKGLARRGVKKMFSS